MEKLTDREVDVMMAIWNSAYDVVPTGEILRHVNHQSKRNSLQTLQVVLRRLCEKEVIACEKSRQTNLYRALIRKEDYLVFATQNFVQHHYPNSVKELLFLLAETASLPVDRVASLIELLQKNMTAQPEGLHNEQ